MNFKRISALSLTISLLFLTACGNSGTSASSSEEEQVDVRTAIQVEIVGESAIANENRLPGQVSAETQTSVMVGTSAQCTAVFVEVGDSVQAGDRICALDLASTIASYSAATISYNAAAQSYRDQEEILDTQITMYEKNLSDLQELFALGAAAQVEIDQARLTLMNARAQKTSALSQLEAGMQTYQATIDQLSSVLRNVDNSGNVVAPVSGTIISLTAVEKGAVSAAAPVAVIDGVDQLQVNVSVSEALIPKIAVGDEVDVTVSAINVSYVGTIREINHSANAQTNLYAVSVSVPEEADDLLPGMFADVTFRTDTSYGAIIIPTEAILSDGDTEYVFVVEDDIARYIEVTTGLTSNGVTEILTGLEAGQQLVTVGQSYLHDGDAVWIISEEE